MVSYARRSDVRYNCKILPNSLIQMSILKFFTENRITFTNLFKPFTSNSAYTANTKSGSREWLTIHHAVRKAKCFTHCTDFAKGILGLAGNPAAIGEAFHITSDEVLTWNQIYECLGAAVGVKPNLHHVACDRIIEYNPKYAGILLGDHANSVIFDNSTIKRFVPGFKCEIPFAVGAKRIADWYQAHPEAKIGDPEWEMEMDAICKL